MIGGSRGAVSRQIPVHCKKATHVCLCGRGPADPDCTCSDPEILRYTRRVSGPLADRIDLYVSVERVPLEDLVHGDAAESTATVRERVVAARARQTERGSRRDCAAPNARLHPRDLIGVCGLDERHLERARLVAEELRLSARAWHRMLRVARTIADLEETEVVGEAHLLEALRYRRQATSQLTPC